MISTISSKNKNFAKLYKWAFARNRTIMIVFSVMMVIGIVIDLYIMTQEVTIRTNEEIWIRASGTLGYSSIIIAQTGAVLLSVISALHTFSFLHNKRSTDMFGAIPSTRSTLYFSHLLGGITAVSIPFAVGSLCVMGFTCRSLDYFLIDFILILFGLISIAAVYGFTALISYCCGTPRDSCIITFGANAIYMGVVTIFWGIASSMIPGVSSFEYFFNTPVMTLLAPMGFCYFLDAYIIYAQTSALWVTIVWSIVFTAVIILLGNYAAKTRKAETAQNEFNIKWLPVVIKIGMSVLAGGFAGVITASSLESGFSNMFAFAFWYIVIGFAAFFILHLIFSRGIKGKFIPSFIAYLCTTAVAVGLVFAMTSGIGIDTYIPSVSNISSVKFGSPQYTYTDPENIKTITEIHKVIIDGIKKDSPSPYYLGSDYGKSQEYYYENDYSFNKKYPIVSSTFFSISYSKKIGFTSNRTYDINQYSMDNFDCDKLEQLFKKLYSSEEYKKISSKIWDSEGARINGKAPTYAELTFFDYQSGYSEEQSVWGSGGYYPTDTKEISTDEKFIEGLYKVIKEDILADNNFYYKYIYSYGSYDDTPPCFGKKFLSLRIEYNTRYDTGYVNNYYMPASNYEGYIYVYVPITDDYTNTLNYLQKYGINTITTDKSSAKLF